MSEIRNDNITPESFNDRDIPEFGDYNISCECCGAENMVYPSDWHQLDGQEWMVELTCGNCNDVTKKVFDEATIEKYDDTLDKSVDSIVLDLRILTRMNMGHYSESFISALNDDHILPEDF